MRRVKDILQKYDSADTTDRKKITIIEWFQEYPGKRFDKKEIHQELADELAVGKGRTGQLLNELEDESVLDSHGDQRKAYELADGILIPIRYQAAAGLRHLWSIIDISRWGVIGVLVVSTLLWLFLTLPFWFFSALLLVSPSNQLGPMGQYDLLIFTFGMTVWLLVFIIFTSSLQLIRQWWQGRNTSE